MKITTFHNYGSLKLTIPSPFTNQNDSKAQLLEKVDVINFNDKKDSVVIG